MPLWRPQPIRPPYQPQPLLRRAYVRGGQTALPAADTSVGAWTTETGGTSNLYQSVGEASPDDATYIQSEVYPQTSVVEVSLSSLTDPSDNTNHSVNLRANIDQVAGGSVSLVTELRNGASAFSTPITWTDSLTTGIQAFQHALTTTQADLIHTAAAYGSLRLRWTATQAVGSAPTYVAAGTSSFTATNATALTPGLPSGWQADDIHILVAHRSDNTAGTTPAGWTQIAALTGNNTAAQRVEVYWRRAVGGDTAPSFTFGSSTVVRGAQIIGIRGCKTSGDPFDTSTGAPTRSSNAASATVTFTDLTTTSNNTFVLALGAYEDDPTTVTTMTNYTQPGSAVQGSALGNDMMLFHEYRTLVSAGAAGAGTVTISGGTFANSPNVGIVIAFLPAAGNSKARIEWADVEVPAGVAATQLSVSGTLTSAGALQWQPNKRLAGTVTSAGVLVKQLTKTVAGTLTSTGALLKQVAIKPVGSIASAGTLANKRIATLLAAGTITSTGALVKLVSQRVSGTLASAGALAKQVNKVLGGAITPAGALFKLIGTRFVGTITSVGSLANLKVAVRLMTGTITSAGTLANVLKRTVTGTLAPAGALAKRVSKTITGAVTSSGALSQLKVFVLAVSGTIASSGALLKQAKKALTGALSPTGAVAKQISKAFTGTLTTIGALVRRVNKLLAGAISSVGSLATSTGIQNISLSGTITSSGALVRKANQTLTGTLASTGAVFKRISRAFTGTLSLAGALFKAPVKRFVGTITSSGTLAQIRAIAIVVTGTIAPVGTLSRQVATRLTGALAPTAALFQTVQKRFSGTLLSSGTLARLRLAFWTATGTINSTGVLFRQVPKGMAGFITPVGSVTKQLSRVFAGVIALIGNLTNTGGVVPGRHRVSDRALFTHTLSDRASILHTVSDSEALVLA